MKREIIQHFILLKEYFKITLASAMEYRFTFILQAVTMFLNNCVWITLWLIFFNRFEQVNGWRMHEMFVLYAVTTLAYGLAGFLFGNRTKIAQLIAEGRYDFYLSLPRDPLFHSLVSRSSAFALGDAIFGIAIGIFVFSWIQIPLFIYLSLLSMTIIISFGIIVGTLGFYWGSAEETSEKMVYGLLAFSTYPFSVFQGTLRIILFLIIPAGFVSGIPVELLTTFNLKWLVIITLFTIIFLLIAILFFRQGLKRYESGNMFTNRV